MSKMTEICGVSKQELSWVVYRIIVKLKEAVDVTKSAESLIKEVLYSVEDKVQQVIFRIEQIHGGCPNKIQEAIKFWEEIYDTRYDVVEQKLESTIA